MTLPSLPEQLTSQYAALISRDVNWGDMDAAHHVNNTVYIRWAEAARIAFWEAAGARFSPNQGPVLAKISAKYIFPVTFPDRVWMGCRMVEGPADSFHLETLIVSERHQRAACLVSASGVLFDYEHQHKLPFDPQLAGLFQEAQTRLLGQAAPKLW
jgi:acyl-CoA thioester hydrolase